MDNTIISDNWSLQDIAALFLKGVEERDAVYVTIDRENNKHEYKAVPTAVISIDALFDFLTDIVLRDQIIVEEQFAHAWKEYDSPIITAYDAGVIRSFPFLKEFDRIQGPREEIIKRLCVTNSLKDAHRENTEGWAQSRITPHRCLSQTLWGGAGMLARGFVYEKGYAPHPVRKRFFIETGLLLANNAFIHLTNTIKEKRASIVFVHMNDDELYALSINMPPLPVRIIQESNSPKDLISVALQMREEYRELRDWLRMYQQALSDGSYRDAQKFQKVLRSISMYVDSMLGNIDQNAGTYTAGIGVLKIAIKRQPINALRNQYGVRSMINKLIFGATGNTELRKLLSFFGDRNTAAGMKVIENFSARGNV